MRTIDYILDGLEAALELERELGVRSVEIDRALLADQPLLEPKPVPRVQPPLKEARPNVVDAWREEPSPARQGGGDRPVADLVFLHDQPLSPAGAEMVEKIVRALHRTPENTPVVIETPIPKAKVAVVLGARAMKKFFPAMKGEPGQWVKSPGGRDVLITYSPEYILRFQSATPAVQKLKQEMWRSLKAVVQRLLLALVVLCGGVAAADGLAARADALLAREPPPRKLDAIGKRLRTPIGDNIATLADAYGETKDRKYLEGAIKYMRAAAAYSDWKPSYYLTCAGVMNGFSRALEVCGKDMDPSVRAELQDVLLNKGLKGSFLGWWWWSRDNWTQVCCHAVAYAALQIRDRYPKRAANYLRDAIEGTKSAMSAYAPDGCYTEGPSYWHYATENTEKMIAVLRRCNGGDDGGIGSMPGYAESKKWMEYMRGPSGKVFGYADGGAVPDMPRVWNVTNVSARVFRGVQPSGAICTPTLWVAMKGGRAAVNHAHMDAGCFVFETVANGKGVRWVEDLGTEKYALMEKAGMDVWNARQSSQRWRVFRQGVLSHSVCTVDGRDFNVRGAATLCKDGENAVSADLGALYGGVWETARRRWLVDDGCLTLEDDFSGVEDGHVYCFNFVTRAKATVEDAARLRLERDGHSLDVVADVAGKWTVEDASRPRQKFDSPNPGVMRVSFSCPLRNGKVRFTWNRRTENK